MLRTSQRLIPIANDVACSRYKMRVSRATPLAIGVLIVSLGMAGCRGLNGPASPTPPQGAQPAPEPKPIPAPTGLQPTVTSVTPNVVSTSSSWGTIRGTQFEPGATVRFGNLTCSAHVVDSTEIQFASPGTHPVGTVDVTVTNPGGFSATLAGGYTYALPDAFDFNGDWIAHAGPEFETDMRFTIQSNVLVSIACGEDRSHAIAVPLEITSGSFPAVGADGFSLTGTILSAQTSTGQVSTPGCGNTRWWADKAGVQR